jgi:hypothetical protein
LDANSLELGMEPPLLAIFERRRNLDLTNGSESPPASELGIRRFQRDDMFLLPKANE